MGGETIHTTGIAGVLTTEVYSQLFLEKEESRACLLLGWGMKEKERTKYKD